MEELKFDDLYVGMEVYDDELDRGVVIECDDIHNVLVQYDEYGQGYFCLMIDCEDYVPLYRCTARKN